MSIESAATPQVVEEGDTLTITIMVSNAGPGSDPGVVVSAMMPEGLDVVGGNSAYNAASGVWDIGEMEAGESVTLTLTVEVTTDDAVVATPSVTGELTDGWVTDDTSCTLVDVQPEGAGGNTADGEEPLTPPGVTWNSEDGDPNGSGHPAPNGSSESGAPGFEMPDIPGSLGDPGSPDSLGTGETSSGATDPSTSTETTDEAAARGDVPASRTTSDSAMIMLGWMLLAAGAVLLLFAAIRRRAAVRWTPER